MHDYENGHTCRSCHKTGINCTIEDGFCENEGDCNDCIKERVYRGAYDDERDGYGHSYDCRHGFDEGEDCPVCEHLDGEHDEEYVGKDWEGAEYPCPLCNGSSEQEAHLIYTNMKMKYMYQEFNGT